MQDAFVRDMFSLSDLSNPRYNGHVSSLGKSTGGKRDRKGCTKGKIEAIMKNNPSRPKLGLTTGPTSRKSPAGQPLAKLDQSEDPYAFSEPEPQAPTVYQHAPHPVAGGVAVAVQPSPPPPLPPTSSKKVQQPTATAASAGLVVKTAVNLPGGGSGQSDRARPLEPPRPVIRPPRLPEAALRAVKPPDVSRKSYKRRRLDPAPHRSRPTELPARWDPNNVVIPAKKEPRKSTWQRERNAKHELLERIHNLQTHLSQFKRDLYPLGVEVSDSDSDESDNSRSMFERDWSGGNEAASRAQRVEVTRAQLRRRLAQTLRGLKVAEEPSTGLLVAVIAAARKFPNATAAILDPSLTNKSPLLNSRARFLLSGERCSYAECEMQSLPCTRHCFRHVMYNVDQRLFSHCTSRGLDSMQCNRPTFDIRHDPPLCSLHAVHQSSLRPSSEYRHSRKVSKKSRVLGLSRPKKSNKKRKKTSSPSRRADPPEVATATAMTTTTAPPVTTELPLVGEVPLLSVLPLEQPAPSVEPSQHHVRPLLPPPTLIEQASLHSLQPHVVTEVLSSDIVEEVPEEVLAIANMDPSELASQAARLLEDPDLHILNQISTDAFNDLFTDKNGEYEPTREETEELERALEAVDNDVRSLERMSRSLPLLNLPLDPMSLLDDPTVAGPFATFQNGLSASDISHT